MRLADKSLNERDVAEMCRSGFDLGIFTHHISSEYASFELMTASYARLRSSERALLGLICKLACPSFGEGHFDEKSLCERVDKYLIKTGQERLDVVQWMWRDTLQDDRMRNRRIRDEADRVTEAFAGLQASGKVKRFSCFPYTRTFMRTVREIGLCDSQTNYHSFADPSMFEAGFAPDSLALCPLATGRIGRLNNGFWKDKAPFVANASWAEHALAYVLSTPGVDGVVVGLSDPAQMSKASAVVQWDMSKCQEWYARNLQHIREQTGVGRDH